MCFLLKESATTENYTYGHTLSLHDARPILHRQGDDVVGDHLHGPAVALGDLVDLLLHRAGVGIHIDGAGVDLALALALAHGTFPIAVCPGTWRTCPCGICWRRQRGRCARQSRPLPRADRKSGV